MRARQFAAFFRMNLQRFLRDKLALLFATLFPLAFVVVYGAIFVSAGPARFTLGIVEGAEGSAELYAHATRLPGIEAVLVEPDAVERALRRNQMIAAVEVGEVHALPANRDLSLLIARAIEAPAGDTARFREVAPSNSVFAFLPGLLVLALLNLALFGTGAQLLADRSSGALKLFRLSPASPVLLYGAQLASRLLLALSQIAVFIAIARFVYEIPLSSGAVWQTLGFAGFGAIVLLSLGYALGSVLRSQTRGMQVFTLTNLFLQFFGDVLFPSTHFPVMRVISAYLPTSYLVDGLRYVMLGLPSANSLGLDAVVLALWGAAALLVIRFRFSYEANA